MDKKYEFLKQTHMDKNLKSLTDQELEQANGGKIAVCESGQLQNSSCRNLRTEADCKAKSHCHWLEDGLCEPADGAQTVGPTARLL